MKDSQHVVLGGNGVVGSETITALLRRGAAVTSVARYPAPLEGATGFRADLMSAEEASRALAGKDVAYFTVGLPYSFRVWVTQWPVILRNVIDAAVQHGTHLVYLDKVYAYGQADAPMTEQTPLRPSSKKGQVRADAIHTLDTARDERGLQFTIGRSADFYGPGAATSVINRFVIDPAVAGKSAPGCSTPGCLTHSRTPPTLVKRSQRSAPPPPRAGARGICRPHPPSPGSSTSNWQLALAHRRRPCRWEPCASLLCSTPLRGRRSKWPTSSRSRTSSNLACSNRRSAPPRRRVAQGSQQPWLRPDAPNGFIAKDA